ncbi:hypothetical protein F4776DRAFT_315714 [Hypoxylon sp. NC0597]|nr:hypothetical protein F4776DRAFT_315714 [Hypoxylon sp. NC0597]
MSTTRSNQAVQGSVGAGSEPRPAPVPEQASVRVSSYIQDTAEPVNVILVSPPTPQSVANPRDHRALLDSIDGLFGRQQQTGGPPAPVPTTTGTGVVLSGSGNMASSVDIALRGVGARFGGSRSASTGTSAGPSYR